MCHALCVRSRASRVNLQLADSGRLPQKISHAWAQLQVERHATVHERAHVLLELGQLRDCRHARIRGHVHQRVVKIQHQCQLARGTQPPRNGCVSARGVRI